MFSQIHPLTQKIILALFWIIGSLPIIFGFFYIWRFGLNIPIWDQWDTIVIWTISYIEHNFQLRDLFIPQGDSRAFFPSLILLSVSLLTNLNIKVTYFLGYILYIISFTLFYRELRRDIGGSLVYSLILLPIIFYWFNPYYLARFVNNIGGVYYGFLILMVIACVFSLDRSRYSKGFFCLAIFLGIICSFSGAWGLVIWFAGLVQIILQKTHEKMTKIIVWLFSTFAIFYLYFFALRFREEGIHGTSGYQDYINTAVHYPLHKLLCFFGTLGSQVIHNAEIALFFGFIIVCVFIALLINNRKTFLFDSLSKWYALTSFWVISSISLALTRSGAIDHDFWGPPDTIFWIPNFRHSPAIFFTLIGLYILVILYVKNLNKNEKFCLLFDRENINLFLLGIVFTLLICASLMHIVPGIKLGIEEYDRGVTAQYYVENLENFLIIDEEQLKILHPDPKTLEERIQKLKDYKLSFFSVSGYEIFNPLQQDASAINISDLPQIPGDTFYHMDAFQDIANPVDNGPIIVHKSITPILHVAGWAVDSPQNSVAKAIFLTVDENKTVPALYLRERSDVAQHFNNPAFKDSGFSGSIKTEPLEEGNHTLKLKIVSMDGKGYYESELIPFFINS